MASLKNIKAIAQARNMSIEELAEKAGIKAQAIHLMARTGSTRIETLERIADVLQVPCSIFFNEQFNIDDFTRFVVKGHHNAFSLYGPSNIDEVSNLTASKDFEIILKAMDETISSLKQQVDDLRRDKEDLRSMNETLRLRLSELETSKN